MWLFSDPLFHAAKCFAYFVSVCLLSSVYSSWLCVDIFRACFRACVGVPGGCMCLSGLCCNDAGLGAPCSNTCVCLRMARPGMGPFHSVPVESAFQKFVKEAERVKKRKEWRQEPSSRREFYLPKDVEASPGVAKLRAMEALRKQAFQNLERFQKWHDTMVRELSLLWDKTTDQAISRDEGTRKDMQVPAGLRFFFLYSGYCPLDGVVRLWACAFVTAPGSVVALHLCSAPCLYTVQSTDG